MTIRWPRLSAAEPRKARSRSWYVWLTVFVGFVVVGTAWSLAQPPFSGGDEVEHFNMGEAVWSGQFVPPLTTGGAQFESGILHVRNPPINASCFIAQAAVSAACDHTSLREPARQEATQDYISRELPTPALLNGLPAYLSPNSIGFYLSRELDVLIGAAGLATAVSLAVSRRRPFLLLGVVLAATPSVIAGFGVIGSSPLEIAAASVLWVTVALLIDGEVPTKRFVTLVALSSVVLVLARPVSFVYLGLAVVALAIAGGRERVVFLARSRSMQVAASLAGVATFVALGWYFLLSAPPNPHWLQLNHFPRVTAPSQRLSIPLGFVQRYWVEAIGAIGFDEYSGPWWMTLGWTALCALIAGIGLLFARARRSIVAVATLLVVMFALPVVAQAVTMPKVYLYWQGRYDLPILAGILTLAASTIDGHLGELPQLRRLGSAVFVGAPIMVALLYFGTLRRFTVGVNGSLNPLAWADGWRPPVPVVVLLPLGVVAVAVAYGAVFWWGRRLSTAEDHRRRPRDRESLKPRSPSVASTNLKTNATRRRVAEGSQGSLRPDSGQDPERRLLGTRVWVCQRCREGVMPGGRQDWDVYARWVMLRRQVSSRR